MLLTVCELPGRTAVLLSTRAVHQAYASTSTTITPATTGELACHHHRPHPNWKLESECHHQRKHCWCQERMLRLYTRQLLLLTLTTSPISSAALSRGATNAAPSTKPAQQVVRLAIALWQTYRRGADTPGTPSQPLFRPVVFRHVITWPRPRNASSWTHRVLGLSVQGSPG